MEPELWMVQLLMKLIIAGSRDIAGTEGHAAVWDALCEGVETFGPDTFITEIVSGGAKGVDSIGEDIAGEHKIPVKKFPVNWQIGRYAGHYRNNKMADYADALVAVWNGSSSGTRHMIGAMRKRDKLVYVHVYKGNKNA